MIYLVKKSQVAPLTVTEVAARLTAGLPLRTEAEHVIKSSTFHSPLLAKSVFLHWSHHSDVRAGRARVRIVEIPERGARC